MGGGGEPDAVADDSDCGSSTPEFDGYDLERVDDRLIQLLDNFTAESNGGVEIINGRIPEVAVGITDRNSNHQGRGCL